MQRELNTYLLTNLLSQNKQRRQINIEKEIILISCVFFSVTSAREASLEIQPNQKTISKEVGGSVALTCRPNVENPSLVTELEWRDPKNRKIDSTNRASPIYIQNLSEEKGVVLIFSSLTGNQGGIYTCRASYATDSLSSSINIETYDDIKFVEAPENQYPIVGNDYIVKCIVNGNPTPIIDWNKNDQSITTNDKYVVLASNGLLIKNVSEADDGVYKCTAVVLNTGQIKSRNIKVEVQVPPKIKPMDSVTIIEGETASIKCTATGKPPPEYQWIKLKNREDLAVADRFEVRKNTGELIMNKIEFADDGDYKCIAENPVERVEAVVRINVLVKPKIYELTNVTAPVKSETKIICKAYGRPPPKVVFRKFNKLDPFRVGQQLDDNRIILEQQFFEEKGEAYGTLIISNLSRSDDGLYECIAENTADTAYKNGHITVEFPPTFERTKDLPPVWSWENKPGNLTCLPEAIPNATIIWRYGNIEITDNTNFQIIGKSPVSFLIVKPYNQRQFYTQYECIATNKYGVANTKIELKHAEAPRAISQARAETITATTIKWSIIPASHFDGLPIRSITVQYLPSVQISWDLSRNHTWSYGAPYILENLVPEETYHFRFAARNDVGMGMYRNVESITMPRRSEPAEPRILTTQSTKEENTSNREDIVTTSPYADHFELRWSVPNDNGDPIQHYLVMFNGEWRDKDCSEQIQQSVRYTSYQLEKLLPDTVYKIELRAHNAIGDSSPAQIKVRTARVFNIIF
ncbi:hypothetical protein NQ314_019498 [Rhamnusium bicolor]|uniref:Fasciclin-2 n=1 Tax=Rhamnusium bicolor TaxID=1586634 RepID=A0AAV8WP81_9CUCU|nr:hypothetical protein NQ314_019498 [Rhamnusium bicolor]